MNWQTPSSAEEGRRDSPRAGAPGAKRKRDSAQPQEWCVGQTIDFIEQHHPPLRGCPPQLRRAVGIRQFIHTFYERLQSKSVSSRFKRSSTLLVFVHQVSGN